MQYVYVTTDLNVAAYLALRFRLETLDRSNPRKVRFTFQDSEELQKAIVEYWNNEATVSPMALLSSVKNLKHRLYDQP